MESDETVLVMDEIDVVAGRAEAGRGPDRRVASSSPLEPRSSEERIDEDSTRSAASRGTQTVSDEALSVTRRRRFTVGQQQLRRRRR